MCTKPAPGCLQRAKERERERERELELERGVSKKKWLCEDKICVRYWSMNFGDACSATMYGTFLYGDKTAKIFQTKKLENQIVFHEKDFNQVYIAVICKRVLIISEKLEKCM